ARTIATRSCRKYPPTASIVPRCSATSNVWLKSSCCSRYVQSPSHGTRTRCPDDEIGSSSVAPCTTPSTKACQSGTPARSPTPAIVSRPAAPRSAAASTYVRPPRIVTNGSRTSRLEHRARPPEGNRANCGLLLGDLLDLASLPP